MSPFHKFQQQELLYLTGLAGAKPGNLKSVVMLEPPRYGQVKLYSYLIEFIEEENRREIW